MNISHIGPENMPITYKYGGAIERRIVEIAKEQVRNGHNVVVYSVGERTEIKKLCGVEIRQIRCISAHPWRQFEFQIRALDGLRRDAEVDIIHFHNQPEGATLSKFLPVKKLLSYDYFYLGVGLRMALYPLYKYFI